MKHRPVFELEVDGRKVRLGERTLIMGVLNVTPDSFSDGGRYLAPDRAIQHGLEMAREGADWIDVGGESTRPGSRPIPAEEELRRVLPVIRGLRRRIPSVPISIDTTKFEVAEQAVRAGASILNDVSGLRFDPRLAEVARRHGTPLVLMHLRGRPETMQQVSFARSIWRSVRDGLVRSIRRALAGGVRRSQLIIDAGMGFGKTRRQNFEILAHLDRLRQFRLPILIGTSRKSFVQAVARGEGLVPSRGRKTAAPFWPLIPHASRGVLRAPTGGESPPLSLPLDDPRAGRHSPPLPSQAGQSTPPPLPLHRGGAGGQSPPLPLLLGDAAAVAATILAGAHIVRVHDVVTLLPAIRIADAILQGGA